jgi:acyl dehydratase
MPLQPSLNDRAGMPAEYLEPTPTPTTQHYAATTITIQSPESYATLSGDHQVYQSPVMNLSSGYA